MHTSYAVCHLLMRYCMGYIYITKTYYCHLITKGNTMSLFTQYDETNAPDGAAQVLTMAKERYGFVPNLAAFVAESPPVLGAILKLSETFDQSTLSAQEKQIVLLTVSSLNDCSYCKTVHTALGKMAEIDNDTIYSNIECKPLKNQKLNALRVFTQFIVEEQGLVDENNKIQDFLDAGYTRAQVFEVVMGVALKTLTNYSNHLVGAEPNKEFVDMAAGKAAA